MRTEHSALIAAAQVLCPDGIRLVFQHLTADERQRLLERAQSLTGRLAGRALQELVEAVEVELDQIGREAVRLLLGDDELPRTIPVGDQVPSEDRDEGLDRGGDVLGTLARPRGARRSGRSGRDAHVRQAGSRAPASVASRPGRRPQGFARRLRSRAARRAGSPAAASAAARRSRPTSREPTHTLCVPGSVRFVTGGCENGGPGRPGGRRTIASQGGDRACCRRARSRGGRGPGGASSGSGGACVRGGNVDLLSGDVRGCPGLRPLGQRRRRGRPGRLARGSQGPRALRGTLQAPHVGFADRRQHRP